MNPANTQRCLEVVAGLRQARHAWRVQAELATHEEDRIQGSQE